MFSAAKTSGPSGGYTLTKSLRFRSNASATLSRTPSVASNRTTWTWSAWVKLGLNNLSSSPAIFQAGYNTIPWTVLLQNTDGSLQIAYSAGSAVGTNTNAVLKDPSAWYHLVWVTDTTQATASNRMKFYINGVQASFSSTNYPAQNFSTPVNNTVAHTLGGWSSQYFDGYLAEVNFIDGQALTASSFGAFSATTGVWQPIKYTGTYGANGFHLAFTNTTSTTTLGYDTSGNGNNWTTNNISLTAGSTYDSMNDVPNLASSTASNYAVWNPSTGTTNVTLSNGNLAASTANTCHTISTIGMTTGFWYWEIVQVANGGNAGIYRYDAPVTNRLPGTANQAYVYNGNGYVYDGNGNPVGSQYATYTTNDVISFAFDATNGKLYVAKNGTYLNSGNPVAGTGAVVTGITTSSLWFAGVADGGGSTTSWTANFGQQGFTYTPPSGYVALNTYNLPTPSIVQDNLYMAVTTWVSAGGTETIVNTVNGVSCQPDFVWMKNRTISQNNYLMNSNSGIGKYLVSNLTQAEANDATFLTSLNSNGFSLGTDGFTAGQSIVAWQWQAGKGTNVTNTNGSITSTVSASTTSGFSIVTYTGTGSNATVGHGLGVSPSMIIVKKRSGTGNWPVYHTGLTSASYDILLNTTGAQNSASAVWNNTAPTSSVFSIGTDSDVNASSATYVAYCFAQIDGFSSFGSYTGNGSSTAGPFAYCGFQPKFILIKPTSNTGDWVLLDTARNTYNSLTNGLFPDSSYQEVNTSSYGTNALSNGFQANGVSVNTSGYTYIYMAFASNPFKYSLGF